MNLGVVGGGSGGHVTPIASFLKYIAIYRKDDQQIKSIVWFGEADSMEQRSCQDCAGVVFQPIASGKLRRYWNIQSTRLNFTDLCRQVYGFFQSLYHLKKYQINVLFCKGGYVALGLSCAAYILRIPLVVHESDTVGGLTNRIVHKLASKSLSGFDHDGYETIGQLLSLDLLEYHNASLSDELSRRHDPSKTTFLVMGGSQGSQVINDHILSLLDTHGPEVKLLSNNCQIIVLCGTKNDIYRDRFRSYKNVKVFGFLGLKEIAYIYSLVDIAITRSSATSVAEQKLFDIRCIYIPLPFTGGNHQYYNALEFCKQYPEDMLLEQSEMHIPGFQAAVEQYVGYKKTQTMLSHESFLYPHIRLYDCILSLKQQKKR